MDSFVYNKMLIRNLKLDCFYQNSASFSTTRQWIDCLHMEEMLSPSFFIKKKRFLFIIQSAETWNFDFAHQVGCFDIRMI